jgi:hypothetical protein
MVLSSAEERGYVQSSKYGSKVGKSEVKKVSREWSGKERKGNNDKETAVLTVMDVV